MNKSKVWVKFDTDKYYNLVLKLNNLGIDVYEIKKFNNYILIKVRLEDYKLIAKTLLTYNTNIYSGVGLIKVKEFINKYLIFIITNIIGIILLLCLNCLIFKVDIKSNNETIINLLKEELKNNGLSEMHLKKRHKETELIVNKILDKNKDKIEWLEIKYDGLIMIVNVVENIQKSNKDSYLNCNIVASKDAKISSLNIYRGTALKEINDYVTKGDIILSGNITHNEETKNTVCADGQIYGEVWYRVKVEVPLIETIKEYTGKNRYNFNIIINDNVYNVFRSRLNVKDEEITNLYKLNDFEINLVKEKEYKNIIKKISEKKAYEKGINSSIEKINLLLDEDEEILYQNVLKKEINDSTIYLELFIVTKENIGYMQIIDEEVKKDE